LILINFYSNEQKKILIKIINSNINHELKTKKISYWWKVMVAFTIVRYSNYYIVLDDMLGIPTPFFAKLNKKKKEVSENKQHDIAIF
jgi:hypothetical protein